MLDNLTKCITFALRNQKLCALTVNKTTTQTHFFRTQTQGPKRGVSIN